MTRAEPYDAALDLARQGRAEDALALAADLVAREPGHAAAWALQGALHMQRARPADALAAYARAVALGDDDARTHLGHGLALLEVERNEEAAASLRRAVDADPSLLRGHIGLARALNGLGRFAEALESADRALALDGQCAEAWRRRGLALIHMDRAEEALAAFRAAPVTGSPVEQSDWLADIGLALVRLGRFDEAMATYDAAVAAAPAAWLAPHRRSFLRLLQGDFGRAWGDYESRWRGRRLPLDTAGQMTPAFRERLTLAPTAADLSGQRVLVVGEQGVGDVIMFASLLPDLMAIAAEVVFLVERRLQGLFALSFPGVAVIAGQGPKLVDLSRIDRVVAIGSLAHAFRPSAAAFPGVPYLQPWPTTIDAWRRRLGDGAQRRVGLSWRGGTGSTRSAARSMSLEALRPLLVRPECEFVSLQYGDTAEEVARMNQTLPRPIVTFPSVEIDDFEQLAGLVCALDAVVTVQTAVAHLTGAVGRPGLVMIPRHPEWRYGEAGETMPWYRSLLLVRQETAGDWDGVVGTVGSALDALPPATA